VIPKKIHYCWLSGETMPESMSACISTWAKVMPDYQLVKWDCSRFDVKSVPFVHEAYRERKWAFAADYIRLYAIFSEGGIYLDTDVIAKKRLDEFLNFGAFTGVEYHKELVRKQKTTTLLNPDGSSKAPMTRKPGIGLQAAILGGVQGHPFFRDCLEFYKDRHFILPDGKRFDETIAPDVYAMIAENYGFRYKNERQLIRENTLILESHVFAGNMDQATKDSFAIHLCSGTWREPSKTNLLLDLGRTIRKAIPLRF
jgi:hypothetical protein